MDPLPLVYGIPVILAGLLFVQLASRVTKTDPGWVFLMTVTAGFLLFIVVGLAYAIGTIVMDVLGVPR